MSFASDVALKYPEKVFCRGYLITTDPIIDTNAFSFIKLWTHHSYHDVHIYVHPQQHLFYKETDNSYTFLIGNCINPFTNEYLEDTILAPISSAWEAGKKEAMEEINKLTGNFFLGFIRDGVFSFITDPTEMLFSTYGIVNENLYLSSHYQLIADLFNFEKDEYTKKLEKYRFFYKYGLFFPGDKTPYSELKRVLTNHMYEYRNGVISFERIYPTEELTECKTEEEYRNLLSDISRVLKNTMICAANKWNTPAISLTGGMDSKTTLSATNGIREKFFYYSYYSMEGDKIDADAAHTIAEHLEIPHTIFNISQNDEDFADCDLDSHREILKHNLGNYRCNPNDIRKRVYFDKHHPFHLEIKSWVSEIGRANYYKKFGLKKMPARLSARNMTSMYKIFLTERKLAKQTDSIFREFIEKSKFNEIPAGYDASDMYLWEFRYSAWGGMVITSEHSYSNEIFIPYNNRLLLNMMLTAPKEKRISDKFHEDLIDFNDPMISETGITITNWNETKFRRIIERGYYLLSSFFNKL